MLQFIDFTLFIVVILICVFHKHVNKTLDKKVDPNKYTLSDFSKDLLISLPLIFIIYRDLMYGSFSIEKFGLPESMNKSLDYILLMLGAYGMIQVLAQDTGIKTGLYQRNTVQQVLLFAPIALGSGYGVTSDRSIALMATLLYFHMKYAISNNVTSNVCFEDV